MGERRNTKISASPLNLSIRPCLRKLKKQSPVKEVYLYFLMKEGKVVLAVLDYRDASQC